MKNLKKKLTLTGLMTAGLLFLSGCVQTHVVDGVRVPTEAATHGITYNFLVRPMSAFVTYSLITCTWVMVGELFLLL